MLLICGWCTKPHQKDKMVAYGERSLSFDRYAVAANRNAPLTIVMCKSFICLVCILFICLFGENTILSTEKDSLQAYRTA